MSQKTQSTPHLQSIKSLPVDFRFMDSSASDPSQNSEALNGNNGTMAYGSIPENGEFADEVVEDMNNSIGRNDDESPYSRLTLLVDERPPTIDENLDSATSPLQSPDPSLDESKWSDTTTYVAKKVTYCFSLSLHFAFILGFYLTYFIFLLIQLLAYCIITAVCFTDLFHVCLNLKQD